LGLPVCVLVFSPVIKSMFFSLCIRSRAICTPNALTSVLCKANVMYMCISRNRSISVPYSFCSISSSFSSSMTSHSKCLWSRLIQMKST
uniref:Uncharacterized protein n=1 Tax=Amphimedon queenslandica TaxID=400682 RepID=A0A1X7TNC6_AMPQE